MSTSAEQLNYVRGLALSDAELVAAVEDAKDWCHCNGVEIRTPEQKDRSDVCQIAPFALFPSPFPHHLYELALEIQQAMIQLYFRVSYDIDFLFEALEPVVRYDEFTRRKLDILRVLRDENALPATALLIQRADYMCHVAEDGAMSLKQIEVNNIAASMAGLGQRIAKLHRRLARKAYAVSAENCPANEPIETVGRGIYNAWKDYGRLDAVVLVVVEEISQNAMDQRFVEFQIEDAYEHSLTSVRLTLTECHSRLSLTAAGELSLDGEQRTVSVVYFRAGYDPSSYPTADEWTARLLIERSKAIKCPWIGLQLANTKKIQQKLSEPGVLERYLHDDPAAAVKIRQTFAGLWGLEPGTDGDDIVKKAITNPSRYVLKPQLEGGARNYYGEEVAEKLAEFGTDERAAHILMERVNPLVVENYLVRAHAGTPALSRVVGELGIFGALLGDSRTMTVRQTVVGGHILRTKYEKVDAGGIAIGAAVIDSPYLV